MDAHHHQHIGDDDVDMMHEEEGEEEGQQQLQDVLHDEQQQQQQQQQGENQDMDAQEVNGEEAREEEDDRRTDEENAMTMEEIIDEAFCGSPGDGEIVERIEQNDPELDTFCPDIYFDDMRAMLLGRALIGNTVLTKLTVSFCDDNEFTSLGARVLALGIIDSNIRDLALMGDEELPWEMSLLYFAKSLVDIALHFPIGDDFVIQLCECLTENKLLERLSIQVDDLTLPGAQVLSCFLRNSSITSLKFRNHWDYPLALSQQGDPVTAVTMRTLFLEGVRHCHNIRDLCLFHILGDMQALVTTLPNLHILSIMYVYGLTTADVEVLAHGLRHAHQLHTLTLTSCRLNDQHLSKLKSPVLGSHPSIKSLTLDNNSIGDAGIASFVEHWSPESKLEELILSSNAIGSKGAELLIKALSNHTKLKLLNLCYNYCIGFVGLALIGKALPASSQIQTLELCNVARVVKYENDACNEAVLQEARRTAAGKALAKGVRNNGHLQLLHLDREDLPANDMEEVDLYLKANVLGRQAALRNQYLLPCGIWCYFLSKEGMSSSLMNLFLRELPGLVTCSR